MITDKDRVRIRMAWDASKRSPCRFPTGAVLVEMGTGTIIGTDWRRCPCKVCLVHGCGYDHGGDCACMSAVETTLMTRWSGECARGVAMYLTHEPRLPDILRMRAGGVTRVVWDGRADIPLAITAQDCRTFIFSCPVDDLSTSR